MKVYHYDENGYYSGSRECQKDQMNPGKFLIPPRSTEVAPPTSALQPNCNWQWVNNAWVQNLTKAVLDQKAHDDALAAQNAAAAAAAAAAPNPAPAQPAKGS